MKISDFIYIKKSAFMYRFDTLAGIILSLVEK